MYGPQHKCFKTTYAQGMAFTSKQASTRNEKLIDNH